MSYSNVYTLNVDLKQTMTSVVPTFAQDETGVLRFRLFDDGKDLDTTPYTYSEIVHKLPSGNKIMGNLDLVTIDGEKLLEYRYTGMEMAELGKVEVQLVIQSANTQVAIRPFKVIIYENMLDDDLTYVGILQELIAEVSLLKEEMYKAINSWVFRNSYSASVQYYRHNVIEYQGSSWIALRDTKGNPPPTLPTISNLNWYLIARKADGGINQTDFDNHINLKATTTQYGHTKLNNTLTSTSTEESATANIVKQLNDDKYSKTGGVISGLTTWGIRGISNKSIYFSDNQPTYGTLIDTKISSTGQGAFFYLKLEGVVRSTTNMRVVPFQLSIAAQAPPEVNTSTINRVFITSNGIHRPLVKMANSNDENKNVLLYIDTREFDTASIYLEGTFLRSNMEISDSNLNIVNGINIVDGVYL